MLIPSMKSLFHQQVIVAEDISEADINQYSSRSVWGYTCAFTPNCAFANRDRNDLRRHLRRHLNVKPFKCGTCGYDAYQRATVSRHMEKYHTGRKPLVRTFSCYLCAFTTSEPGGMTRHMKQHGVM